MSKKYMLVLLCYQLLQSAHAQLDANVVCTQGGLTVTQIECETLVIFYNSAVNPSWPLANTWGSADVNSWAGVTEDAGHVVELDMPATSLAGTLPDQWSGLNHLVYIRMQGSGLLTGELPAGLSDLLVLDTLIIVGTGLGGSIPPQLGAMNSLTDLTLVYSSFSGSIPAELGSLINLKTLHLEHNLLTGTIPETLGNLTNLTELYLDYNQLTGSIPATLGDIWSLEELYLDRNQLSGSIPVALGDLSNLKELYLLENQLTGALSVRLSGLTNLHTFQVQFNYLDADDNHNAIIPAGLFGWYQNVQSAFIHGQIPVLIFTDGFEN